MHAVIFASVKCLNDIRMRKLPNGCHFSFKTNESAVSINWIGRKNF